MICGDEPESDESESELVPEDEAEDAAEPDDAAEPGVPIVDAGGDAAGPSQ